VLAAGREILEQEPRGLSDVATRLGSRWPDRDAMSLGYASDVPDPVIRLGSAAAT
jgi:hypothetical protein